MAPIVTLTINPTVDKSVIVDRVVPERKLRCGPPRFDPGGGGLNVARAVCRLGGEATALYPCGGITGQMLERLMDQEGIPHRPIQIAGLTRENLHVYEESTGQQFRFNMPGPTLREAEWKQCLAELASIQPTPAYVVASGSLAPGVPTDFFARVARIGKERKARVIVDTSGEALRRAAQAGVYLLKPNLHELSQMAGRDLTDEEEQVRAAQEIIQHDECAAVVVSLAAAGVLLVTKEGAEHLRAPTVPILSRIGAGDSMVAGIVLGLARGETLRNAVRFGLAAGTAAVMQHGTQLCRREDAERLYSRMTP